MPSDGNSPSRAASPPPVPYDVIVVLGAALLPDGRPSRALERRVDHAVALFRAGHAEHLLVSGGLSGPPPTEAAVMRARALEDGVPDDRICVEDRAVNTFENALFSGVIMERRGWSRPLVVTDAYHLPRALYVFRRLGIDAAGSGVPRMADEPLHLWIGAWLREGVATARSAALFLIGRHKPAVEAARARFDQIDPI